MTAWGRPEAPAEWERGKRINENGQQGEEEEGAHTEGEEGTGGTVRARIVFISETAPFSHA